MFTKQNTVGILNEAWNTLDGAHYSAEKASCSSTILERIAVAMAATVEAIEMLEAEDA